MLRSRISKKVPTTHLLMQSGPPPLDQIPREAKRFGLTLAIHDRNQFSFVLSDGALPREGDVERHISGMRSKASRHAVLLVRTVFLHENIAVVSNNGKSERVLLEFQPCVIVGRNKVGMATVRIDPIPAPDGIPHDEVAQVVHDQNDCELVIPDLGDLLAGLEQTTRSLELTETLLASPEMLTSSDDSVNNTLHHEIIASKDKVLSGLTALGNVLSQGACCNSREEWLARVSAAVAATIEALVSFDDYSGHVRDDKLREMKALRAAIESYFGTIDPVADVEECEKFSRGINRLILDEHRDNIIKKKIKIEEGIEKTYGDIITMLQHALPKSTAISFLPLPIVRPAEGFYAKFVFNMVHVVMAVQNGGLAIRLDTDKHIRLHRDCKGWDEACPPRVHIIDRRNYDNMQRRGRLKNAIIDDG